MFSAKNVVMYVFGIMYFCSNKNLVYCFLHVHVQDVVKLNLSVEITCVYTFLLTRNFIIVHKCLILYMLCTM